MGDLLAGEVDLVLTDPPYCISKETGFSKFGKNSVLRLAWILSGTTGVATIGNNR